MNDLAGLANKAAEAASRAIAVSDELHIELAHIRIREMWPNAKSWSRQYEMEDGVGAWYLTEVKLEDDSIAPLYTYATPTREGEVTEILDILGDIWTAEDHRTVVTRCYDE